MSEAQGKQTNYLGIGAAVVILAIVLVAVISQASKPSGTVVLPASEQDNATDTATDTAAAGTSETGTAPVNDTPETAIATSTYEDGTYTMVGSYSSPAGPESLGVTLTLKDDVITEVSVEKMATNPVSIAKQDDFAANYKTLVVGKKIEDVELGKVSGSSLTPKGFNDAINKIEAEAKNAS